MLEQDLFPRYEEWCDQEGVKQPQSSARNTVGLLDRSRLGDREKMREAMVALLEMPEVRRAESSHTYHTTAANHHHLTRCFDFLSLLSLSV